MQSYENIIRDLLATMREAASRLENESHDPEEIADFLRFAARGYAEVFEAQRKRLTGG